MNGAEFIASEFHRVYEQLAPFFGYETRRESAVPWADVPERNRMLMIAVIDDLIVRRIIEPGPGAT